MNASHTQDSWYLFDFRISSGCDRQRYALERRKHPEHWNIPYLPIDPHDVGREYESDVIRINSQSGKGGISYVLEENFGFHIPGKMREDVGYIQRCI